MGYDIPKDHSHGPTAAESAEALNERVRQMREDEARGLKWSPQVKEVLLNRANKRTPADFLEEIAGIYRQRKPMYGDNYKHVGKAMVGLFPEGLHIAAGDAETWNRLHFVMHMYSKLSRYCQNLQRGGHQDSLDDLAVYAMLARECDEEEKEKGRG